MTDPERNVQPAIGQAHDCVRRAGGQLVLVDEVERGGRRGLEQQSLHRTDAATGEVRQQHERLGRAEPVEGGVVLPHGPTAPLARTDRPHHLDHRLELGIIGLSLVTRVIPSRPRAGLVRTDVHPDLGQGCRRDGQRRDHDQTGSSQRHQGTHHCAGRDGHRHRATERCDPVPGAPLLPLGRTQTPVQVPCPDVEAPAAGQSGNR